jgi:uncharacterized damage-inducible protein DinB
VLSELENYRSRLDELRRLVNETLVDMPVEGLNWRPIQAQGDHATNSLAVLAVHVAGAEHFWIAEVIGGQPSTRNRAAEFATSAATPAELLALLDHTGKETQAVFLGLSEKDLDGTRQVESKVIPVRWALLHVVDHTSLHLGHMQITRQLWAGGKSVPSPLWFQRLPPSDHPA